MTQHSEKPLKQMVDEYYQRIELSPEQLKCLQAMQVPAQSVARESWSGRQQFKQYGGWLFGCCALLLLAVQLWWPHIASGPYPKAHEIAAEVAYNHFNRRPLETRGSSFPTLSGYFTQLQFEPVLSSLLAGEVFQGARYCSLSSIRAAQFRVEDVNGEEQTWYQVDYQPEVFGPLPDIGRGDAPVVAYGKGLPVKIWVEKGMLFALTQNPDNYRKAVEQ
ncbi:hypothetical protein [Aliamphritea hakodatensis]|uniref:hypothetical protein n=1 Tax=Aliamphritea hakodatensis TaxID=2895352 RepID=UPI0022FD654B|nr:hypothetical protein [Aliamphritea hakodatensis]